jgi:hypothetical protein
MKIRKLSGKWRSKKHILSGEKIIRKFLFMNPDIPEIIEANAR